MKRTPPKSNDPERPWRHVRLGVVRVLTELGRWEWVKWPRRDGGVKLGLRIPTGRRPQRVTEWEFKLSGGSWIRRAQVAPGANEGKKTT